jgi:phospholipase/carboxylesterase
VPLTLAEQSRQQLQSLGFTVYFKTYPMQHNVCADEIRDMAQWLDARFAIR